MRSSGASVMTPAEARDTLIRMGVSPEAAARAEIGGEAETSKFSKTEMPKTIAPARARHRPGVMNDAESAYAAHLTSLGRRWWFEAMTLRLADDCRYTVDFVVIAEDDTLEMIDVKAWWKKARKVGWTEDARIKWRTAAEMFPLFAFVAVWQQDGEWKEEMAR